MYDCVSKYDRRVHVEIFWCVLCVVNMMWWCYNLIEWCINFFLCGMLHVYVAITMAFCVCVAMCMQSCQPSKIAPLSALWKIRNRWELYGYLKIVKWPLKSTLTILHVHCTCTHMRSTWTSKLHVLCRKFNGTQKTLQNM